jgi:hypothetical protein
MCPLPGPGNSAEAAGISGNPFILSLSKGNPHPATRLITPTSSQKQKSRKMNGRNALDDCLSG